jgi:MFS transporter, DHA1 family, multidrug resistance protein
MDLMLPALPTIGAALHVENPNHRAWIISAFMAGIGVGALFFGPLSDHFGRKRTLTTAITFLLISSLICALSGSFTVMLVARFIAGIFAASCRVVTVSIVRDCFVGDNMARVMSLCTIVFMLVPMAAPALGQVLLSVMSWRWIFGVLVILGSILLVWIIIRLPETLLPKNRVTISPRQMGATFLLIISHRTSMGYVTATSILMGAQFGFLLSVQQIVFDVFHAPRTLPLVCIGATIWMVVGSLLNSRLVRRIGARRMSQGALLAFAILSLIHVGIAWNGWETLPSFVGFQGLMMLCMAFSIGNFSSIMMEPFAHGAGVAASVQGFITTLGSVCLSSLIGLAFNGSTLPLALAYLAASILSIGVVIWAERGKLFTRPNNQHLREM